MRTVSFQTSDAYDHVPRALDLLRKMNFALIGLSVDVKNGACLAVLTFERRGALSSAVFVDRLRQINGVVFCDDEDESPKTVSYASHREASSGGAFSEL